MITHHGWIVNLKKSPSGFVYTLIVQGKGFVRFFMKTSSFTLFDRAEIAAEEGTVTLFPKHSHLVEESPLRNNPGNLLPASYISYLISFFTSFEKDEEIFILYALKSISDQFSFNTLELTEMLWLRTMGLGLENGEKTDVAISRYINSESPLRKSLLNHIIKKYGGELCSLAT